MVLRLSSAPASNGGTTLVDQLVQHECNNTPRLVDGMKTLKVILKNLCDPIKSQDVKYRTLKLDNPKLQQKLFSLTFLRQTMLPALGFVPDGDELLVIPADAVETHRELWQATFEQVTNRITAMTTQEQETLHDASNKKPKMSAPVVQLSEKQKARRMLAEKEIRDKQVAKEERKRQVALIKADKLVRETDPNWKPRVSAAADKAGTGISTFRDKYGES